MRTGHRWSLNGYIIPTLMLSDLSWTIQIRSQWKFGILPRLVGRFFDEFVRQIPEICECATNLASGRTGMDAVCKKW